MLLEEKMIPDINAQLKDLDSFFTPRASHFTTWCKKAGMYRNRMVCHHANLPGLNWGVCFNPDMRFILTCSMFPSWGFVFTFDSSRWILMESFDIHNHPLCPTNGWNIGAERWNSYFSKIASSSRVHVGFWSSVSFHTSNSILLMLQKSHTTTWHVTCSIKPCK